MTIKTPAQLAYESELMIKPHYHDGTKRPEWAKLSDVAKWSWHKNPNPRYTLNQGNIAE